MGRVLASFGRRAHPRSPQVMPCDLLGIGFLCLCHSVEADVGIFRPERLQAWATFWVKRSLSR